MNISRLIILFFFTSLVCGQNFSSIKVIADTFQVQENGQYQLSRTAIFPSSIKVNADGNLLNRANFRYSPETRIITLFGNIIKKNNGFVIINYESINIGLKPLYQNRKLVQRNISNNQEFRAVKSESAITIDDIFGKRLSKSGTISRGFTVSTNKDFTVNSGLRLELSGKLSDDIEIVAALTDENLPFQPEGNTERLEELDKVFIQIKHPNVTAIFGDYEVNQAGSVFGNYQRKLQGLKIGSRYKKNNGTLAIANSRGKYHSNSFYGTDGMQGPYRLRGKNNEREIVVISGTEKVFVDGREMRRGESNQYTIDYSTAEIIFTARQLITSASRITIDFEYSDRKYNRSFLAAQFSTKLFSDKLQVGVNYAREGDDYDSPIDFELSDEEKIILQNAGFDRLDAFIDGAVLSEPDSAGVRNGTYIKVDTLISGESFQYFNYSPDDPGAIYNVYFSYIGESGGDYVKQTFGNYKFVGHGKGQYLPVRLIPLPELLQTSNIHFEAKPFESVNIKLELAGSLHDKNRLSNLVADKSGFASNINLDFEKNNVKILGQNIYRVGISYRDRFIKDTFTPLDRINDVEFDRDYNIEGSTATGDEALRELDISLMPISEIKFNAKYGLLKKTGVLTSERFLGNLNITDSKIYGLKYNYDAAETDIGLLKSDWINQKAEGFYSVAGVRPGVELASEEKLSKQQNDSLTLDSHRYTEIKPFIEYDNLKGFKLKASYSYREESFPIEGEMIMQSDAEIQSYSLQYAGLREINSTVDVIIRKKNITDEFRMKGFEDNKSVLIRNQSRINLFSGFFDGIIYYETSTQQTAKREKVFLKVQQGTGNYKYVGDTNENGIAEENEFELTLYDGDFIITTIPTEELFPVVDLKSSLRFSFNFKNLFSKRSSLYKYFKFISTESYFRIEENSKLKDVNKIYFMNFNYFRKDSTTISGSEFFQQDLYINKSNREFSLRFRFNQKKSLYQYSVGIENGFALEKSVMLRFRLINEIGIEADYANKQDNLIAPSSSNRSRIVNSNELSGNLSYRPSREIEAGLKIKIGRLEDRFPESPTIIDENSQMLKIAVNFIQKGRLLLEVERIELLANTNENYIPFEISKGNSIGKNYFLRLNFDYKITDFIQSSISYNARKHGAGDIIHAMRTEIRAYF